MVVKNINGEVLIPESITFIVEVFGERYEINETLISNNNLSIRKLESEEGLSLSPISTNEIEIK